MSAFLPCHMAYFSMTALSITSSSAQISTNNTIFIAYRKIGYRKELLFSYLPLKTQILREATPVMNHRKRKQKTKESKKEKPFAPFALIRVNNELKSFIFNLFKTVSHS